MASNREHGGPVRLGIVDCDTGHVVEFTRRLNHVDVPEEQWVEGARVVAAVPGTSLVSPELVDGYAARLRGYGVELLDDPAELLGRVDAVLIESVDGSVHLERALPFVEAGLPLYVDKPFTTSVAAARTLLAAAQARRVPLVSASSLRYSLELQDVLRRRDELGPVLGADVYSPAGLHPRNPGLFHYGVHAVEPLYELMGTGCQSVRCVREAGVEVVVGRWAGGRLGTVRGTRSGTHAYGFTAFCERRVVAAAVDTRYIYRELLKVIVATFVSGTWPLSPEALLEPVAFQEAALRSAERGGDEVPLDGAPARASQP